MSSSSPVTAQKSTLRKLYGFISHQPRLRKAVMTTPGLRQLAWRFVAGEDLDAGVAAVRSLNARGIRASLNFVGTHVHERAEALSAADAAIEALQRIHGEDLAANLSVKPTQLGLDIDEEFCRLQLRRVVERALSLGLFVRVDMEEFVYVEPTLRLFEELRTEFGADTVGIVIQSYLRDRASDLERVLDGGSSVRLTKGGYWEPEVAYRDKADIDRCFDRDIKLLLSRGRSPAIATHDEHFVNLARELATQAGLAASDFEFQMLYGVRSDLQEQLASEGYKVRCYIPYGGQWFPYFLGCVRRLPGGAMKRLRGRSR
jgi:proline dehydrogenase